jgi:hypothetical protein
MVIIRSHPLVSDQVVLRYIRDPRQHSSSLLTVASETEMTLASTPNFFTEILCTKLIHKVDECNG